MADAVYVFQTEDFSTQVSEGVTLVDFYADWCGPCKMQAPILEEIAKEMGGRMKIGKINIDDHQDVAAQYQITSIPTMIIFKNGKEMQRIIGLKDKSSLKKLLEAAI